MFFKFLDLINFISRVKFEVKSHHLTIEMSEVPEPPPRWCPKCQQSGVTSKVKRTRLKPGSEKVLICTFDEVRTLILKFLNNIPLTNGSLPHCSVYLALHPAGDRGDVPFQSTSVNYH